MNQPPIYNSTPFNPKATRELLEKADKYIPITKPEDLKVYAIISCHASISSFINDASMKLFLFGAHTLDEAMAINVSFLESELKETFHQWHPASLAASVPYSQVIPAIKIGEMVESIEKQLIFEHHILPKKDHETMAAYTRYIFNKADATPYEKGILTAVINRFKLKVKNNN